MEDASELRAHVATYYQLADAGGPNDVAVLRTALRGEQDPVARMAAAEALYLVRPRRRHRAPRVPREPRARRGEPRPAPRGAAREARVELPVLGSLADLASEGSGEAALRLVEVAPVATRESAPAARYAQLLGEVAVDAGEPLLAALRKAPAPAADAAITALARGDRLARGCDAAAVPLALLARAGSGDGEAGAFARDVAAKIAERARTERAVRHTAPADAIGPSTQPIAPREEAVAPGRRRGACQRSLLALLSHALATSQATERRASPW